MVRTTPRAALIAAVVALMLLGGCVTTAPIDAPADPSVTVTPAPVSEDPSATLAHESTSPAPYGGSAIREAMRDLPTAHHSPYGGSAIWAEIWE